MKKRQLSPSTTTGSKSEDRLNGVQAKVVKTHPFFSRTSSASVQKTGNSLTWLSSPDWPHEHCLHGVNLHPKPSSRIAGFDLDGTLISGNFRVKDKKAWSWWRNVVPTKLRQLHEGGYAIIIFSNQNINHLAVWKEKLQLIAAALPDVPFRIFAATRKDGHRKPMPGMWHELERIYALDGVVIDKGASFYVGDAAGRPSGPNGKDHASSDRQWALNVGVPFFTPEEFFLELPASQYKMEGFHVSTLSAQPLYTPTSTPLLFRAPTDQEPYTTSSSQSAITTSASGPKEIILFVGPPCAGKSSFFRTHIQVMNHSYVHVEGRALKARARCAQKAEEALKDEKSCVLDDTHASMFSRKYAITLARKFEIPIRCFLFTASLELAWHNNLYRAYLQPRIISDQKLSRPALPKEEFRAFRDQYQEPTISEGFAEIKRINWVWNGTDEERKCWELWTLPMK
ncbi:PNK3P-domain-containing protein [Punctularia strigosozonata HHB-11173 SS5]|uniref:PNK3P-domain-containing protein n=1 Tax=Punctularia strigosozonata (strain HHB-11173) TaxID=741275 RepID=UPI0004417F4D|nr:PNK3P-domain-containing protein [Punctularia strigosozonata HHB-11173 SS5]EIN13709.1 PNK3P-domain-containing protein [Punctularia strigosozonata HHB-11173 SS5]